MRISRWGVIRTTRNSEPCPDTTSTSRQQIHPPNVFNCVYSRDLCMLECNIRKSDHECLALQSIQMPRPLIQFCQFTERNAFAGIQYQTVRLNCPIPNAITNALETRKSYVADILPSTFLKRALSVSGPRIHLYSKCIFIVFFCSLSHRIHSSSWRVRLQIGFTKSTNCIFTHAQWSRCSSSASIIKAII